MSPEPFVSRAEAPPAKRREKGYGDENIFPLDGRRKTGSARSQENQRIPRDNVMSYVSVFALIGQVEHAHRGKC